MTAIRQPLTTDAVYLYLEDGVPTRSTGFFNHNALYEINLPQAERIEVMKGPANALYGSDAIGGVINAQTRPPAETPEAEASLEGGSHGFARLLASASTGGAGGGVRVDANYTRSDGWRDGTAYDRTSATLRWDVRDMAGLSLRTVASASRVDQGTAGSSALSREHYEALPELNYAPISFRDVSALRVSSEIGARVGAATIAVTPYLRANAMELLPNWSLTYDPALWESENLSFGVLAKASRPLPWMDGQIIVGVDVDHAPGSHFERAVTPAREGPVFRAYEEGAPIYDYDVTFRQASPYAHAELAPTERIHVSAGLRADFIRYRYDNRLSVVQSGRHRRPDDASPSYSALSPKLGVTFEASQAVSLFAAYRRGFRVPSEGQLFRQGSAENTVGLRPVLSDSYEVGARGLLGSVVRYELSAYHMAMTDEILGYQLADGSAETVNAGETRHRGVELGIGVQLPADLQVDVALAVGEHAYVAWSPRPGVELSGNEQESAPNVIAHGELGWAPAGRPGTGASLTWDHLGPYWMDQANLHEYRGHHLFGVTARHQVTERVGVFLGVTNLADKRYAERATFNDFRGEELAPGAPLTFRLGVEVR